MKLVSINWSPSPSQLRQFGCCCTVVLPIIGWWWGFSFVSLMILVSVGLALALLSWCVPSLVRPLFVGIMVATAPIGMLLGELAMLFIYLFIFCPIGFVFRRMQRDALKLRMSIATKSYWKTKSQPKELDRYYRRF